MFNKQSNKILSFIFGALLLITIVVLFFDGGEERSFRKTLVTVDTADVSRIVITGKQGKSVDLLKESGSWKVKTGENRFADVPQAKIEGIFRQLETIKPKSLAARSENKWAAYQVDSTGTRVEVYEDGDKTLDLILGRFNYNQQTRAMATYVRLANETDVYEVDGFLSAAFNTETSQYRDGNIVDVAKDKWTRLDFNMPGDSSFTMTKLEGKWQINGAPTDSAATANYLRSLDFATSSSFVDNAEVEEPTHTLKIETEEGNSIILKGYENRLIHTSDNPDTYFDASKGGLWDKVFTSSDKLIK